MTDASWVSSAFPSRAAAVRKPGPSRAARRWRLLGQRISGEMAEQQEGDRSNEGQVFLE